MQYAALSFVQTLQYTLYRYLNRPTANSTASIAIWLLGALATKTFLVELGISVGQAAWIGMLLALVFQAVLTLLEGPIWGTAPRTHRTRFILGAGALVVDTALNTGGCWYFLQNLGNTTFWRAIATATNTDQGPSSLTILGLSLLIGIAISAAPEALWDI